MIFIAEPYRGLLAQLGAAPAKIFDDPAIKPWRKLNDRQNCTWDLQHDGQKVRLHVKRFPKLRGKSPAQAEAEGYRLLEERKIPTARVAAWGNLPDGRSFIAMEDLAGFEPADKLIARGMPFDQLLEPTAALAAQLHGAQLHHRDLYLCHFMAKADAEGKVELRLIDAARVRRLPGLLTRRRWIVKDLAQFWYSTLALKVSDQQRDRWLERYASATNSTATGATKKAIIAKARAIGAHDEKLRRKQPLRNISIPN